MVPLRLLFQLLLASSFSLQLTQSSFACWGNGVLVDGACRCDPGWKGSTCNVLDLKPVRKSSPGLTPSNWGGGGLTGTLSPNWGASAIYEGGWWWIIAGMKRPGVASDFFSENCGLFKLKSKDVGGPYTVEGEHLRSLET